MREALKGIVLVCWDLVVEDMSSCYHLSGCPGVEVGETAADHSLDTREVRDKVDVSDLPFVPSSKELARLFREDGRWNFWIICRLHTARNEPKSPMRDKELMTDR